MDTTPDEATADKPVHLTQADTWSIVLTGSEFRNLWTEREESDDLQHPGTREVFDWSLTVYLEDGGTARVTHPDIIKAMQVMVAEREQRTTKDSIIDLIAAVLDAENHDAATDELAQLDSIDCDLIAQVAAVGKVVCP